MDAHSPLPLIDSDGTCENAQVAHPSGSNLQLAAETCEFVNYLPSINSARYTQRILQKSRIGPFVHRIRESPSFIPPPMYMKDGLSSQGRSVWGSTKYMLPLAHHSWRSRREQD